MKKTILRYGLYGALIEVVFFFVSLIIAGVTKANYEVLKINCYPAIIVSLSFTYFGICYYRDKKNGGLITFNKALTIGLLIVLIPALCFAFSDTIYDTVLDTHFYDKIEMEKIKQLQQSIPPAQFAAGVKKLEQQFDLYKNPCVNFAVMFFTVGGIGFIVTLISAVMLQRKSNKKAIA